MRVRHSGVIADPVTRLIRRKTRREPTPDELALCRCPVVGVECVMHPEATVLERAGAALRERREALGLRQVDAGAPGGYSQAWVSVIESGTFSKGIRNLVTYAGLLGCDIEIMIKSRDEGIENAGTGER